MLCPPPPPHRSERPLQLLGLVQRLATSMTEKEYLNPLHLSRRLNFAAQVASIAVAESLLVAQGVVPCGL